MCKACITRAASANACEERVDLIAARGLQRPDFRAISDFRNCRLEALADLFVQILRLCREAGLVKLGHFALDGSKTTTNASKHEAMSYGPAAAGGDRGSGRGRGLAGSHQAGKCGGRHAHGPERRSDEPPDWDEDKQARLATDTAATGPSPGMGEGGPLARVHRNFTEPDSRVLKTRDGFLQGYHGQLAVDAADQVIIAQRPTTSGADQAGLAPLVDATKAVLGRKAHEVSVDAGFCRETNLAALDARGMRG